MRAFAVLLVLVVLFVSVSAVSVPYKWCGASTDDATLDSIVSNEFPPVKGDTLTLNVTGNLTKEVTSGTYTISVTVSGFPLPDITGDISAFRAVPWPVGELNFTYSQAIPSAAPSGSYTVKISAVDQDSNEIFCINIAFSLKAQLEEEDESPLLLPQDDQQSQQLVEQLLALRPIRRLQPIQSTVQRIKTDMRMMPRMKPIKGNNRRL